MLTFMSVFNHEEATNSNPEAKLRRDRLPLMLKTTRDQRFYDSIQILLSIH